MADGFIKLTGIRVWSTNVYYCVYFNGYLKENIMKDINGGIIHHAQTGSSWKFKRFNHLNMHPRTNKLSIADWKNVIFSKIC